MIDLDTSIALQLERIAALDLEIEALVGEENQLKRLQGEVDALEGLASRAKVPPALRGCLVGIKDIFHVDGLPTRAGSLLPPEALAGEEAACGLRSFRPRVHRRAGRVACQSKQD